MAIPPVARRKMKMKEELRRRDQQKTILAAGAMLVLMAFFLLYHIRYNARDHQVLSSSNKLPHPTTAIGVQQEVVRSGALRGAPNRNARVWIPQDAQPFNQNSVASKTTHLIVVAGHSVTVAGNLEQAGTDESVWYLLDYQKGRGLPQAIVAHIQAGIDAAHADPSALLVMSGGETRAATGPVTEGSSYFRVADAMQLWPTTNNNDNKSSSTVRARTVTEEFATDSFENLLFSLCRFHEVTGHYPTRISMVSFTFKQTRFETLHAPALHWPADRFHYIGVDPPATTGFDLQQSTKGELENAARPFESDPYGCHSPVLQEKRRSRNPFSRTPPYELTCPDIKSLLHFCGPQIFPKSQLPWANL